MEFLNDFGVVDEYTLKCGLVGKGLHSKYKLSRVKICIRAQEVYAIKYIEVTKTSLDPLYIDEIKNEAVILRELNHPNIVKIFDCRLNSTLRLVTGKELQIHYIVLEYIEGTKLLEFHLLHWEISEEEARFIFNELINAIEYLHLKGFIHRDLKPENLLIDKNANIKLIDFGFTSPKNFEKFNHESFVSLSKNNPALRAPEILDSTKKIDEKVDSFGCGVILYFILMKENPLKMFSPNKKFSNFFSNNFSSEITNSEPNNNTVNYSTDFKDFISNLLTLEPAARFSISEIKNHNWMKLNIPDKNTYISKYSKILSQIKLKKEENKKKMENFQKNNYIHGGHKAHLSTGDLIEKYSNLKMKTYMNFPWILTVQDYLIDGKLIYIIIHDYMKKIAGDINDDKFFFKAKFNVMKSGSYIEGKIEIQKLEEKFYLIVKRKSGLLTCFIDFYKSLVAYIDLNITNQML